MCDEELGFVLDTMTWSFSRLQSFYNCAYEWYLHYVEGAPSENGFFGEYGSLLHKVLEKYANGELSLFELNDYYDEHFAEDIVHDAPPNNYVDIKQSYYNKGLDYLNNIDLDLDNYEILGVEKKVEFEIGGKPFVGFIDLLVRDKESDEITIIDHKSASIKVLKNGNISKSDLEHFQMFKRQLYLYSIPLLKEYGKISKLKWNMFKDQKWIETPWKQEEYEEAIKWVEDTLALIEAEKEWRPNPDKYFCWNLCGQRNNACPYKPKFEKKENAEDKYFNPETEKYE